MASSVLITEEASIPCASFDSLPWHVGLASVSQRHGEGPQMCLRFCLHNNGSHGLCEALIGCRCCRYWRFITLPGPPIFTRWLGRREGRGRISAGGERLECRCVAKGNEMSGWKVSPQALAGVVFWHLPHLPRILWFPIFHLACAVMVCILATNLT